jgi:hypothetical protein
VQQKNNVKVLYNLLNQAAWNFVSKNLMVNKLSDIKFTKRSYLTTINPQEDSFNIVISNIPTYSVPEAICNGTLDGAMGCYGKNMINRKLNILEQVLTSRMQFAIEFYIQSQLKMYNNDINELKNTQINNIRQLSRPHDIRLAITKLPELQILAMLQQVNLPQVAVDSLPKKQLELYKTMNDVDKRNMVTRAYKKATSNYRHSIESIFITQTTRNIAFK